MDGLDVGQFKTLVRETLTRLGGTTDVVNLVTGTCMVESGLKYVAQITGPALGVCQMEPATFEDIKGRYLNAHPELYQTVLDTLGMNRLNAGDLKGSLTLSIVMCRLRYMLDRQPIPSSAEDLAQYYKRVYNTYKGKADVLKATEIFKVAIATK